MPAGRRDLERLRGLLRSWRHRAGVHPIAYPDALKDLWLTHVITHPLRCASYRAEVFSRYFFTSSFEYWDFEWNREAAKVGYPLGDPRVDHVFKPDVVKFALGVLPMLFTPWFWSLLAVTMALVLWAAMRPWARRGGAPVTRAFSEHEAEPTRLGDSYE